jgi:type VI secretion system protein ImpL
MKIKAKPALPKLKLETAKALPKLQSSAEAQEIHAAVAFYLRECGVGAFSFHRKRMLYDRPWFLVVGPEGSGKTTLLANCGIDFPFVYPSIEDGYVPGESTQPSAVWWCSHTAVWLDLPGRLVAEGGTPALKEIIEALAHERPRCPVNGMVIVLDCAVMAQSDNDEVRAGAATLRGVIDRCIKSWGIELPVYLILSQADKITGFTELFSDPTGKWNDRMLGATIKGTEIDQFPRIAFLEQFDPLMESLSDIRLRMLALEKDETRRAKMCHFPIEIAALREKIAIYIAALFKQTAYAGKPCFCGFYFTSCTPAGRTITAKPRDELDLDAAMLDHPLNPHKKRKQAAPEKSKLRFLPHFVKPVFSILIPGSVSTVSPTAIKFRRDAVSLSVRTAVAAALIVIGFIIFGSSYLNIRAIEQQARVDLDAKITLNAGGIASLERIHNRYKQFARYDSGHGPLGMFITGYNTHHAAASVKSAFVRSVQESIVKPCIVVLEQDMHEAINSESANYAQLKDLLSAYIAVTDQVLRWPQVLDNDSLVADILLRYVKTDIIRDAGSQAKTAASAKKVLSAWCAIAREDSCRAIPNRTNADIGLIDQTRRTLIDLMNPSVRYGIIIGNCALAARDLTIKDIIPDVPNNGILKAKRPLNDLFTPEQWRAVILPKFSSAGNGLKEKEPWVLGDYAAETAADSPALTAALTQIYLDEAVQHWLDFFSGIAIDSVASIEDAQATLIALCAKKSPMQSLVQQFGQWSKEFVPADSTGEMANVFKKFSRRLAFFQEFVDDYYPDYNTKLSAVAEGIGSAIADKSTATVFNGGHDDPLIRAATHFNQAIAPFLESRESGCLRRLIFSPIEQTLMTLAVSLRQELNAAWVQRVYQPYANDFAKKYPFIRKDQKAERQVVLRYFHPLHGNFWSVFNKYLSNRVVERQGVWSADTSKPGLIPMRFNPMLYNSLSCAKTISSVFFDSTTGNTRNWDIGLTLKNSGLKAQEIFLNGKSQSLISGQKFTIHWPAKEDEIQGRIQAIDPEGNKVVCLLSGPWSMMELLNASIIAKSRVKYLAEFDIQCELHTHGISHSLPAKVSVSDANNPFCFNVFDGFSVPNVLVEK